MEIESKFPIALFALVLRPFNAMKSRSHFYSLIILCDKFKIINLNANKHRTCIARPTESNIHNSMAINHFRIDIILPSHRKILCAPRQTSTWMEMRMVRQFSRAHALSGHSIYGMMICVFTFMCQFRGTLLQLKRISALMLWWMQNFQEKMCHSGFPSLGTILNSIVQRIQSIIPWININYL